MLLAQIEYPEMAVALLAHGEVPEYAGANITAVQELPAHQADAVEVVSGGERIVRRGISQVLGVR